MVSAGGHSDRWRRVHRVRGAQLGGARQHDRGIYGRPIALGNFAQFAIVAITLLKQLADVRDYPALLVVTAGYVLFAVWFGAVLFGPGPVKP